jgi:formylglycine-generating enzyme required for sulfatase activity
MSRRPHEQDFVSRNGWVLCALGLLALGLLWLRVRRHQPAAAPAAAPAVIAPAPAPADPDPAYTALLKQAEDEVARQDYRLAAAFFMQALNRSPQRPEARARLESLRTQLIVQHPELAQTPAMPAGEQPAMPARPAVPPPLDSASGETVAIPGGPFRMGAGSPGGSPDEYPAHEVVLSPFSIDTHDVTVAQYREFCARTHRPFPRQPSGSTPRHPVVSVRWGDAQAYCRHRGRRLPTEAEWERAARCGAGSRYPFGDQPHFLEFYAWFAGDSGGQAHPVGLKPTAGCGLSDAYGNVWQWTADWYSAYYYDNSPRSNPTGPRSGEEKVLRGGAFDSPPEALAGTFRDKSSPDYGAENRGFRCAASKVP